MKLEYEKLLEITNKLPEDEGKYVLAFLLSNDRKIQMKLGDLEKVKRKTEDLNRQLEKKLAQEKPCWYKKPKEPTQEGLVRQLESLNGLLQKLIEKPDGKPPIIPSNLFIQLWSLKEKVGEWLDYQSKINQEAQSEVI